MKTIIQAQQLNLGGSFGNSFLKTYLQTKKINFMKKITPIVLTITTILILMFSACNTTTTTKATEAEPVKEITLDGNISMYTHTWDEIINKGRLDLFNDTNFTTDLVMHEGAMDIKGIDSARAYYANFLTGFSDISFTIKDVFGDGDKIVKYWNFKGVHTGNFFGIAATNKGVSVDGVTLVRMENGKIAEERDFIDNLDFMQQLGVIPK